MTDLPSQPVSTVSQRRLIVMLPVVAVLVAVALVVLPGLGVQASPTATFTVDTTNDTSAVDANTGPLDSSGNISLRSATERANRLGGASTINLPAGTYTLTIDELPIGDFSGGTNISIVGGGTPADTIITTGGGSYRVFDVDPNGLGASFSISNVSIKQGYGVPSYGGGAILAAGGVDFTPDVVTIDNCVLDSNTAPSGNNGGAIHFNGGGTLTIQNSTLSNNSAPGGSGGAVYVSSNGNAITVTINSTTFSGNFSGPIAEGALGGGLFLSIDSNRATLTNVIFTGNQARTFDSSNVGQGGGLYLGGGDLTVNAPSFTGNAATVNGGGTGLGGAFYAAGGTLTVTNGTLDGTGGAGELFALDNSAAAIVRGATLKNAPTVFRNLGSATFTAYANNILTYTTAFAGTGSPAIGHNYWGTNDPSASAPTGMPVGEWPKRLGAPVSSWSDGPAGPAGTNLGSASLKGGTSGIVAVVSHGRGISHVPFGNGNAPYANQTCSDYYDFFTLSGGGTYTATVPVDDLPSCLSNTLTLKKVFQITNLAACSSATPNTACWNLISAGTSVSGGAIRITGLTDSDLGGTPIVAGDPAGLDPTAVTLTNFGVAETAGTNLLWLALLAVGLLLGLGAVRWSRHRSTRA